MDLIERFVPAYRRAFAARPDVGHSRARFQKLAAGLTDAISLNSGDPDLPAAPEAVEASIRALRDGRTHYALGGLPELRAAIACKLAENGVTADPDAQVVITNGAAEAISLVFQVLLAPGDEVLTTDPCYPGFVSGIAAAQGIPVPVPITAERLWEPDPAEIESKITPRTKAFVFANPGNPSGAVYSRETLQALVDLARRKNILMISDELFERYVYDGFRHISIASLPGASDHTITIGGFSKSYCMTGWRLGWIVPPLWLARPLTEMRYSMSMAAATANQWGAVAALSDAAVPYYDRVYKTFGERRVFFYEAFARMGLPQRRAPGAYMMILDVQRTGRTAEEVAEIFIREARVIVSPVSALGTHGRAWVRVCLIQPLEALKEMANRLEPIIGRLLD